MTKTTTFQFLQKVLKLLSHPSTIFLCFLQGVEYYDFAGYYYLCDAAYTHTRGFMAPYRGVRYWLRDFHRRRAITKEEKFNHAHAKLRNVIERAYGVLKARFSILRLMAPFSIDTQRDIVIACFAVHNFIRKKKLFDSLFAEFDSQNIFDMDGGSTSDEDHGASGPGWTGEDQQYMIGLREEIALQLM